MKAKLGLMLALLAMFNFSTLNAAPIDKELAILASEQAKNQTTTTSTEEVAKPAPKSKQELEAEQKRLREEKRAEEKRLKAEREAARKQIEEGKKEKIDISTDRRTRNTSAEVSPADENKTVTPTSTTSTTPTTTQTEPAATLPNPITTYKTYDELSKAVNFAPLYIPKKSGYTVNEFLSIDKKVAEIRYGRRWEPEVSLSVRTYKRAPNEELQDISGVQGAKWRVDESAGTTIYLTKINDGDHAAAWAVGDYTFSAYVQNLSFAAFYALVVEELVDLTNHYYVV